MLTRATSVALLALVGSAVSAHAGLTATVMHIEATTTVGNTTYTGWYNWVVTGDTNNDGVIDTGEGLLPENTWALDPQQPVSIAARDAHGNIITDGQGNAIEIATVLGADFGYVTDPVVSANFNVQAGFFNTNFNITSAVLNFGDPNQNTGIASASISVTGNGNGGSLFETDANGIFRAIFNNNTTPSTFAYLHNLAPAGALTAGPNQTVIYTDAFGYAPLGGTASDISAKFAFTLSAGAQASGTSVFTVIPAPGSAVLLGLSGLIVGRRRR